MPDNKKKKVEVTDKALLDQLNAESNTQVATAPQREEVTDPNLLTELSSEENSVQKKSPDVSTGGLETPSQNGQNISSESKQDVIDNIFGKDISGNPIINTNPHTNPHTNPPPPIDPKEETNHAINTLASHVVQNALPHYEENLNNTQFTEPGNVVHDITNPHGDAQMTGAYARYGIEQLRLQRQQELGKLAQSGGSTNPDYQQQEDAINSKYNEQISQLQNAALHLTSLQLANREYAAKKYTQAESDEQLRDLDKEYKKELSTATGGGDVNIAKTAYEKSKAEIKKNTKYDAVQLGMEQQKMLGNKSAEEDLVKYSNGQPIPDDKKVAYQLNGLNIIQTGARNAAANGQADVAKDMADNSSDIQERLEKDNPRYFQKQYAQQIGNYLYNNENNPLFGTLFARGIPDEDKIKAAGKAAGLTPDEIKQVRPEDIPTTASAVGQAAQGAFNAFLFQDEKDPYGELFTGKMPQEQHTFNNWRGITGEIAGGAGTVAGFLAQGGIIGEGLKSGELLGNVVTKAKSYETASNLIPLALANYNSAYEQSKEVIGDKPKDELKRHAYAALNATISTAIMSIDPATALGKDALGMTKEGRDIIGWLKKDGLSDISPNDFKDKIANVIANAATTGEETAKHIGSQALIMASNKAAENVTDMFFDPEHRHGIMDNVGQSAIQGGISMFLPSLFAGINTSRMENPSNKELLWDVGNNSRDYRTQVTDLYKLGKMSQDDFFTAINGINKAAGIIKSDLPATNAVNDIPLTDQQKKDYAWNLLQSNEVSDKLKRLGEGDKVDKSQTKLLNDRLTELTAERSKILDKAGEEVPIEKPTPLNRRTSGKTENISEKPTNESKEDLSLSPDNISSNSSQQNVTTNEKSRNNDQDNGQNRAQNSGTQEIGPNSDIRQAASVEASEGQDSGKINEAPGKANDNKEGGAEMQPPISVSGKERRKRKPLIVDEEHPIPVVEEPKLQTQDLGEVKGQPEAKTEQEIKAATVEHPEKPADVLVADHPQGESFNEAKDRFKGALDEIAKDAPDNTVVVTHSWGLKLIDAAEKTGWDHPDLGEEHQKGTTEPGDLIPYKMEDGRTIWFARHGETEDNLNDLQRTNDTPLTEKGREQAKEIADKLKEKGITPSQIITSDLPRAKETSDIISKQFKTEENASTQSEEQQQESVQQGSEPEHARTEQAGSEKPTTEATDSHSNERSERGEEKEIKTPEGFTASKSNDTRKDGKLIFKKEDGDISHEIVVKEDGNTYVTATDKKSLFGIDEHSKSMESNIKEFNNLDEAVKYVNDQKTKKEKTPEDRVKEIDEDLTKQKASQKLEGQKRSEAKKKGDIESINKHNENWHKKQIRIDKLEEEKEEITKSIEKEVRQIEIKKSYTDSANKIREFGKKITANSEGMVGAFPGISPKVVGKFIEHVADIVENIGNLHVAIDAGMHWLKEQFPDEKEPTKEEIVKIEEALHYLRPDIHSEPVLPTDHEEYAKDLLADVNDGKLTHDEAVNEVMAEPWLNREGKPVSDAIARKLNGKIINYLEWHDKDRAIHNASLAEPGEKNNVLKDYVLTNGDAMTKFLSGETIEKRTGDNPLNPQQVIKYNLELATTDAQSMVSKIKHHFGNDILGWASAMIKQIDKLPGGDTVKRVTALLGLMDELRKDQGIYEYERTTLSSEKDGERIKEVNRYLSEIPKILKAAEKTYQTTQREASKTLNAGRIMAKLFTGKFAHELHADEAVLAPKQQEAKKELEDKEADTKIPDKVAEEGVIRDEKTANKELEEAQEKIIPKPLTKGKGKSTVERMKERGAKLDKKEKLATEQLKKEALENLAKKGMNPENMFDKIKELIKKNPC